jgi:YVTN family beta-propeller protein
MVGALVGYALLALALSVARGAGAAQSAVPAAIGPAAFSAPTNSSPIAMTADNSRIWVVNPDDDSVSVIDPATDTVVNKFNVGDEPQSVALDLNGIAYVANAASNDVSIVSPTSGVLGTLTTGADPWNIVASPDGLRVFVANSGQDTLTVIRTDTRQIVGSVNLRTSACNVGDTNRHFQPRGIAVTLDSKILYATRFFSFTKPGGVQATDDGKVGVVCRIELPTAITTLPTQFTPITLGSQNTGFAAKIADVDTPTRGYPNQLQSIVIRGGQAFLPNIAASPAGPLKFNVDTQAFVNVLDGVTAATPVSTVDASATKFLNLHLGARQPEAGKTKLFFANPWAIAFTNQSGSGSAYVVSAGSDLLVKVNVSATGVLSFTGACPTCDFNTARYIDLHDPANALTSGANAGKNPLGIVIRNIAPGNNKAYIMNYVSRNVAVVNLDTDTVAHAPISLTAQPAPNTTEEQIQVGKEVFFASRGVFDGGKHDRLSSEGWQNCASCHFAGLTDGNIWSFETGARKSIPLNGTFNPHNPDEQRALNFSAVRDQTQDFELNIRNISGPGFLDPPTNKVFDPNHGLLISDTGDINAAPSVINNFALSNAGRQQLTITLPGSNKPWPALDAMNEWIRFAVRTPNSPLTVQQLTAANAPTTGAPNQTVINQGRTLFLKAGCQTCHGGGKWSNSVVDTVPPPGDDLATEVAGPLPPPGGSPAPPAGVTPVGAQHLFKLLQDIGSFNLGVLGQGNPIDGNIGAIERASTVNKADSAGLLALGKDHNLDGRGDGYNVSSLLGIYASPPYYHNGACETLACVVSDINHRRKGLRTGQTDPINVTNQASVVAFLESIAAETKPATNLYVNKHDIFLDPAAPIAGQVVTPGVYLSIFGPNITFDIPIKVRFRLFRLGTSAPINTQTVSLAAFTRDFGQERVVAAPITLPSQPGLYRLEVFADSDDTFVEDRENDNTAARSFFVRPVPPDRTPPVISNVAINNDELVTTSRNVSVKFNASDPAGSGGQSVSGLDSFCIVRYYYNVVQRRWVEENCDFRQLPAASPPGTFTVNTTLPNRPGVAYAFVWVKDKAGNISTVPGFDFINFIPSGQQQLDRNDVLIIRIRLGASQGASLTVTPTSGDVDTTVFQGITNPVRCDVSAIKNGTQPETASVPSASCTGTEFQFEIRAVVNSRFTLALVQTSAAASAARSPQAIGPQAKLVPSDPTVAGPPLQQSAIDAAAPLSLPFITR